MLVRGVLRLAAKYQVDSLRTRIVQHLEEDWPTSPLAWLRMCNDERLYTEDCARYTTFNIGTFAEDKFPEPAAAIRLARDFDIPSILPAAYLKLLYADPTLDWDDLRKTKDSSHGRSARSARWNLLDRLDMHRLAQGRARLVARLPHVHRAFLVRAQTCRADADNPDAQDCHEVLARKHNTFTAVRYSSFWTGGEEAGKPDLIQLLQKLRDVADDWKLCASCVELFRARIAEEIKLLWDDLPQIFGLIPDQP